MHALMSTYLRDKGAAYAGVIRSNAQKGDDPENERVRALMNELMEAGIEWNDLPAKVVEIMGPFAAGAANDALDQIDVHAGIAFENVNEEAVAWAKDRAAEMVGMKYTDDGLLIDNPKAEWAINETTREQLAELVTDAVRDGWSNDKLADAIEASTGFDEDRAMLIARTETAMADVQGNMVGYRAAADLGIELGKEWITAEDDLVSDECALNADAGVIGIDDTFPSGASAPPEHPNCRCDVVPVRFPTDEPEGD